MAFLESSQASLLSMNKPHYISKYSKKETMGEKGVKLFGMWASPFTFRVQWALRLKGIEYEYVNEELTKKSPELLHYNPVTKKLPTLVHDGRAVAESLVILEYIDEMWPDCYPIMPKDPYERAQARFWAKFAEDKCLPVLSTAYSTAGEELQQAVKESQEVLKTLEKALEGKRFFGGDSFGYLDIVIGWIAYMLPMLEDMAGVSVVNEASLPLMKAWFHLVLDVQVVKESLLPKDKLYDLNRKRREQLLAGHMSSNN